MIEVETKGKQGLFDAFLQLVDKDTYNGYSSYLCLVGQVYERLGLEGYRCSAVAEHFDVEYYDVLDIYEGVDSPGLALNYEKALDYAASALGVER